LVLEDLRFQWRALERWIRRDKIALAFCSSDRRRAVRPRPPRLMKNVIIRRPELGPFGETFLDDSVRAIVAALFVNNPCGGWVESVLTFATQRFDFAVGMEPSVMLEILNRPFMRLGRAPRFERS